MTEDEFARLVDEERIAVVHFSHFADMGRGLSFPDDMLRAISNTNVWTLSCCALTPGRRIQLPGEVGIVLRPELSNVLSVNNGDAGASTLPDGSELSGGQRPSREAVLKSLDPGLHSYNEWRVFGAKVVGIFVSRVDHVAVKKRLSFDCPIGPEQTIAWVSVPLGVVFDAFPGLPVYEMGTSGLTQLTRPTPTSVEVKPPSECSDEEIEAFCALIVSAGEVTPQGLEGRVRGSALLCFLWHSGDLVGVAGLKHPSVNHRVEVETGSGEELDAAEFPIEIGWVYVRPEQRGGRSMSLCTPLLERVRSVGVFATSRVDNRPMHSTLRKLGFKQSGCDWPSGLNPAKLLLFVRKPT
ncbi:MAG: hypothetical protein V4542_06620 [Pseudomonadota bacterium]